MLELDYLTKPIGMAELARALEYQKLAADDSKSEKVFLIVDDDPATLEMHVRIVQSQLGTHQVLRARNGREALELMQQTRPDLVLLDLMMPELDGFGVLEAMREKKATRDIPVIVLTGQMLTEKEMARLNRGVATVLGKGLFSVDETLSHIDAALARKRKLGSAAQRLVRQAMAYLHEHYSEQISRDDLAHHLGMNGDYLTYCFRKEVGMTPIAYLNRYRVNQAKLLLAESDKNVTEVAMSVGFSDSGYFSRVFRRQVGVSPDAYRRT
jgi:YesN/AraC family two-component response regulator